MSRPRRPPALSLLLAPSPPPTLPFDLDHLTLVFAGKAGKAGADKADKAGAAPKPRAAPEAEEASESGDSESSGSSGDGSASAASEHLVYRDVFQKEGPADEDDEARFRGAGGAFVPVLLPAAPGCKEPWDGFSAQLDGEVITLVRAAPPERMCRVAEVLAKLGLDEEELKKHALNIAGGACGVAAAVVSLGGAALSLRARREPYIFKIAQTMAAKETYASGTPWRSLPGKKHRCKRVFSFAQFLSEAFNADPSFRGRLENAFSYARACLLEQGLDFLQRAHLGVSGRPPEVLDPAFYECCLDAVNTAGEPALAEIVGNTHQPPSTRLLLLSGRGLESESGFLEAINAGADSGCDNPLTWLVPVVLSLLNVGRKTLKGLGGAFADLLTFDGGLDALAPLPGAEVPPAGLFYLATLIVTQWLRLRDAEEGAPDFSTRSFVNQLDLYDRVVGWHERLLEDLDDRVHPYGEGATAGTAEGLELIGLFPLDAVDAPEARQALQETEEITASPPEAAVSTETKRRGLGGKRKGGGGGGRGGGGGGAGGKKAKK